MELAKSGNIGKICLPNALTTFKEYLSDFAEDDTKKTCEKFLKDELEKVEGTAREKTEKMIERINEGERDVYL